MPNTNPSANMALPLPIPGVDPGPDYALNNNVCFTLIDQHDHSIGKGVPIAPAGLNINTDLTFQNQNATNFRSTRFFIQGGLLSGAQDLGCCYVSGVDLYFNDVNGNQVRLTASGAVAGTPGSIANLVAPASATYVAGTPAFVFQSDVSTPANLDGGSLTIRQILASAHGITLASPNSLAANYQWTLPPSLPAGGTRFITINSSGTMANRLELDGATLNVNAGDPDLMQVAPQGITFLQIANATITGTQLSSNIDLPGKHATAGSQDIVVSANPATNGLMIVRGSVNSSGNAKITGEGFTISKNGVGDFTILFNATYGTAPDVVATILAAINQPLNEFVVNIGPPTTAGVRVFINLINGSPQDVNFSFIAIGERA